MVSNTREKQVVTKAAYVLFYRRRSIVITDPEAPLGATADQSDEDEEFLDVEPATEFMLDRTSSRGSISVAGSSLQGGGDCDMVGMLAAGPGIPTVVSEIDNTEEDPLLRYTDDTPLLDRNRFSEARPLRRSCSYTDMDAVD